MSITPLQTLKTEINPDLYAAIDNDTDSLLVLSVYKGASSTLPTDKYFQKGAILVHETEGNVYINNGDNGETPSFTKVDTTTPVVNVADVVALQRSTTAGGSATETFTISGVLATDEVFVTLVDGGTDSVSIVSATTGAGNVAITFSADPKDDTIVSIMVMRKN